MSEVRTFENPRISWEFVSPVAAALMPAANEDGKPHLTYFIYDRDTSFVWSGVYGDSIQVCPNGYGEPVRALIHTSDLEVKANGEVYKSVDLNPKMPLTSHLEFFQRMCDEWTRQLAEADQEYFCENCGGELPDHEPNCKLVKR